MRNKRALRSWIAETIAGKGFQLNSLNIILVDDKHIARLNEKLLHHKGATDVLTFQYNGKGEAVDGEVFISTETVAENAKRFKVSLEHELHRVMIHGVLHLLGYSDKTPAMRKKMKRAEDSRLRFLNV